jgi:predicted amidohydrolase YtcJ
MIEVGKLADFVILSDDIFSADVSSIRSINVLTTVIGGKVVYVRHL